MLRIYETALEVIRMLRPVMGEIPSRDPDLANQLGRASSGVALCIAEGSYSRGRNRNALYHRLVERFGRAYAKDAGVVDFPGKGAPAMPVVSSSVGGNCHVCAALVEVSP